MHPRQVTTQVEGTYGRPMRTLLIASLCVMVAGCKDKAGTKPDTMETEYVEKELRALEQALADGSESSITIGCAALEASTARMTRSIVARIEGLCHVAGPKLLLRKGIAEVKAATMPSELADLGCMQLFAPDAVVIVDKHPTQDAELQALVDEFTKLCPKDVEKARAKP